MKKYLLLLLATLFIAVLAACGTSEEGSENSGSGSEDSSGNENSSEETTEITIGASSTPHAEILEEARPLLEEEGITLKIEEYQDYILPNEDLANGTLDANYFQHEPYLNDQIKQFDYNFVSIGGIHIEPMGVYSQSISNVDEIPDGTEVIISRSVADHGRILAMFEEESLITLAEGVDKVAATVEDIEENPKNLEFSPDVDAAVLPEMYETEDEALVAINTNYAIEAGLVPNEDAVFVEGENSPYVNLIVARAEDEGNEALQKLVDVLHSDEIQTFMEEEYGGAIVPVDQ